MKYNTHQVGGEQVERVTRNGREYLKFPLVPMREMVLNYPENGTKEYLPAQAIARSAPAWAGVPLVHRHPPDRGQGQTARVPEAYLEDDIGQLHQPEALNGGEKLRGHGLIDIEKANSIGGPAERVVDLLASGETVSVSAAYGTLDEDHTPGTFDGEDYDLVQNGLVPDHVAIFPSDEHRARCPPEAGCAAPRVNHAAPPATDDPQNAMTDGDPVDPESLGHRLLGMMDGLGLSTNAEGAGTHSHDHDGDGADDCGCGGTCDSCGPTTNSTDDDDGADADDGDGDDDDAGDSATDTDDDPDDDTDDTMSDDNDYTERVERLADQTPFDADELAEMSDDQLTAIAGDQPSDDGGDADADADADDGATADTTADADADDGQAVTANAELVETVETLQEEVAELRSEKQNAQKRGDAEIVANALDMDVDAAMSMDEDHLSELADEHRDSVAPTAGATEPQVNYGAVPGQVDRSSGDEDLSHVSAGTRTDFDGGEGGDA